MPLDAKHFPRSARYLASLPKGVDSFPECRVRTDSQIDGFKQYAALFPAEAIGPDVRRHLEAMDTAPWMPEVVANLTRLMIRDKAYADDAAFFQWNYEISIQVFKSPVYRMLMALISPTLLMMGATKRWGAFREGTRLEPKVGKNGGQLILRYPAGLYESVMLEVFAAAFRGALDISRAKNSRVTVGKSGDGITPYDIVWEG